MRSSVVKFALYCVFATPAIADLSAHLSLAQTQDIQLLVVCSQGAEFNADRLRGFVADATGISPNFSIMDGPEEFRRLESGKDANSKALIVFSKGMLDQSLKDCISETVSFGEVAFDSINEAQASLGGPLPIPNAHWYLPVYTTARTTPIKGSEWVLYVYASNLSNNASVNEAMILLFGLDPDECSDNAFCLPQQE